MEDDRIRDDKSGKNPESAKAPGSSDRDNNNRDYNYRSHRTSRDEESYDDKRARRAFSYVWNIIWSLILIIFFNFFSTYIAYFQYEQSNGSLIWHKFTLLTADFSKLVPLITAGLIIIVAGSIILLIFDKYILAKVVELISSIFAIAVLGNFLIMFPIDFNIIPYEKVAQLLPLILKIVIGLIILILIVQIIANFVKIVVEIAKK